MGGQSSDGQGGSGENLFHLFDIGTSTFSTGPDIPEARHGHGCGVVDTEEKGVELVVAGGVRYACQFTLCFGVLLN